MHITHRSQARIDPNTIVTIYLQYSGVDLSSSTSDDVGGGVRMMETSAEVDGSGFREVLERIRKMGNVRIVEADGT
jgi:signal transduction histidine kinase